MQWYIQTQSGSSSTVSRSNWNLKCRSLWREENRRPRRKTLGARENHQQTQPTDDAGSVIRTRDTLVGGECSHHCAILAPQSGKAKPKASPPFDAARGWLGGDNKVQPGGYAVSNCRTARFNLFSSINKRSIFQVEKIF